jgi:hypothetical protein
MLMLMTSIEVMAGLKPAYADRDIVKDAVESFFILPLN